MIGEVAHHLALEREHQPQHPVGGRVAGPMLIVKSSVSCSASVPKTGASIRSIVTDCSRSR